MIFAAFTATKLQDRKLKHDEGKCLTKAKAFYFQIAFVTST